MIRFQRFPAVFCLLVALLINVRPASGGEEQATAPPASGIRSFQAGEALTYNVSWSNVLSAGIAVMEVKAERLPDGREGFRFIATDYSVGAVNAVYPVKDTYESLFDPRGMRALAFSLSELHKKKLRRRDVVFDYEKHTVVSTLNEDPPVTAPIQDQALDSLSSIYYLRTREDLSKPISMNVFDSGKIWSVEIQPLGKETVSTPAGKFQTIKIKTNPKYEGVFKTTGDMFFWLTDDVRKIPVIIKSKLSFGSIVMTLKEIKPGDGKR